MDRTYVVNRTNCEMVAQMIVDRLSGAVFAMVSFYHMLDGKKTPTTLAGMSINGGYHSRDGCLTVRLHPRRKIFWNLNVEKVVVRFNDSDSSVIIERYFADGGTLFRVLMILA